MIVRARLVVTMDGAPIENGGVLISGERIDDSPPGSSPSQASRRCRSAPAGSIVDVGKFSDVSNAHSGEKVVDLGEQALMPGLINAHCHLDYTCLRGKIPRQKSFTDWIRAINAEKAKLSADDYIGSINDGFAEAKRFGTTTIVNLTAFPELISRIQAPIRTWWFPELIDVRESIGTENLNAICIQVSKAAKHWGLAPHAPFTASTDLFRRCEEIAGRENVSLTTHLAESREEMSMFQDASGSLYDFLKEIGRDMSDCGGRTPLEWWRATPSRSGAGNRPYLLVHLNELDENDFELLAKMAKNFSVVHCPRSHAYFGHSPFQFEKLRALGFNICLGTDSLASNDNLSLFAEMRAFQKGFPDVSPEEILKMVTLNPALALGKPHVLGRIRKNHWADLISVPVRKPASAFEEIIAFDQPVTWSMVDGRILA